jgi:surface polysaccharide O-acyltransferase-like enzyme
MARRNVALSNLRGVVIVIVLAFHSSLAYLTSAPDPHRAFDQPPYTWQAFPIVDAHRWIGFDIFCAWQDVSLMALMFFLSGLLAAASLQRKGARTYTLDRTWRIGLPFVLAVVFLSPIAFYPAYASRALEPSLEGFWNEWISLRLWPAGPQWFLWQLMAVNALAGALYWLKPDYIERLRRLGAWAGTRPVKFFALLIAVSAAGYVPLALPYSPWTWGSLGPFSLQFSRPAVYVVYFFAGIALGSHGLDRGLLAEDGPLARHIGRLMAAAAASFAVWAGFTSLTMPEWQNAGLTAQLGAAIAFPVACAFCGMILLAAFLRFGRRQNRILDSLSDHAYSMYMAHYVFVVWLQYALLGVGLIAAAKLAIVLTGSVAMSWTASIAFVRLTANSQVLAAKRATVPAPR